MRRRRFHPVVNINIGPAQADNCHGRHHKDIFVFHETISPDAKGKADIMSVSEFLDNKDFGIHSIIDAEGILAVAVGQMDCIFYHTLSTGSKGEGMINSRGIGCELVSNIPLQIKVNILRFKAWRARRAQIIKAAKFLAGVSRDFGIPLEYTEGHRPGVTTHWQITMTFGVPGGHTDCWPKHKGGYFPVLEIISRAKRYKKFGWVF